jgi:hypothetical protein
MPYSARVIAHLLARHGVTHVRHLPSDEGPSLMVMRSGDHENCQQEAGHAVVGRAEVAQPWLMRRTCWAILG